MAMNYSHAPSDSAQYGKGLEGPSTAVEEVPYLIFQAILFYEQNSTLDNYAAFVGCMNGTTFQFAKGVFSHSYLHDLINHQVPSDSLKIYRSQPYELLEQEDRKEFVKIYIGLFQCISNLLQGYQTV